MKDLFLSTFETILLNIRGSDSDIVIPESLRIFVKLRMLSNAEEIVALVSPDLICSEFALRPIERANASIKIDFPAPVSPVKTLKPESKETKSSFKIAKFFIWISLSIPKRNQADSRNDEGLGSIGIFIVISVYSFSFESKDMFPPCILTIISLAI